MYFALTIIAAIAATVLPAVQAAPLQGGQVRNDLSGVDGGPGLSKYGTPSRNTVLDASSACGSSDLERRGAKGSRPKIGCLTAEPEVEVEYGGVDEEDMPHYRVQKALEATMDSVIFAWPHFTIDSQETLYNDAIKPFLLKAHQLFSANGFRDVVQEPGDDFTGPSFKSVLDGYQATATAIEDLPDNQWNELWALNTKVKSTLINLKEVDAGWQNYLSVYVSLLS